MKLLVTFVLDFFVIILSTLLVIFLITFFGYCGCECGTCQQVVD